MSKSKILAAMLVLISSTSLCKANTCPSQRDLNDQNITELSHHGQTSIDGKVYKMIGKNKTGNDYNHKLLDTSKHLEDFLKINKHGEINKHDEKVRSRFVSVQIPEGFCAYNISVGEQSAMIALSTNPDKVGVRPPLPTTSSPSKPPRPTAPTPNKL
jgi:hypothetical protein